MNFTLKKQIFKPFFTFESKIRSKNRPVYQGVCPRDTKIRINVENSK